MTDSGSGPDWARVEDIFHEVADLDDPEVQARRIDARCGDDRELCAAVAALLAGDRWARADVEDDDPHVGARLGPYTVGRRVGRGGMASVYEGQRGDGAFMQRVAVKIMDLRLSDPALVVQFKAERQILARLEHPSVTRLLDGGVTALGEPYLVMEFVDGQSIDRFCDARRLTVPARLALFAEVCDAVASAHRALVLHRDLKPSNILVTDDGRVKVVDFGTATLLQPDRLATTSTAPLTPAYASPEQLTGKPVGTASDQYSLGVVLFELLTGAPPFGGQSSLLAAMERALTGTTTSAPAAVVSAAAAAARQTSLARLRRVLSTDLGTIVRKALAPEPELRYASVQHLADDLGRWLDGLPIAGRPASFAYRTSRFLRRHWVASSVAAGLALALAGATAVSVHQARLARAEAVRAQTESQRAQAFNGFLTRMLSAANPHWSNADGARAGSITVREVLDGASELVTADATLDPAVEADIRLSLGRTYAGIGELTLARQHLERALDIGERLGLDREVAQAQQHLTTTFLFSGEAVNAERVARPALNYARAHSERDAETHFILANDLSVALSMQRRATEALAYLEESAAVIERHQIRSGGAAVVVHNLGLYRLEGGQVDDAEPYVRRSLQMMESLPSPPPEHAMALRTLTDILMLQRRDGEARAVAERAAAEAARVWPEVHQHRSAIQLALGRARLADGDPEEARVAFRTALAIIRQLRPPDHADRLLPLIGLAAAERALGNPRGALALARQAESGLSRFPEHPSLAAAAAEVGLALRALQREPEAIVALRRSHESYRARLGDTHPSTRLAAERLGLP